MPLEQAALLGCAALTGVGAALFAARVQPGTSALVVGAGGVGQFVVQGARIAGAETIVAVDPFAGRREQALALGATHAVEPDDLKALVRSLAPEGLDYGFDAVGDPSTTATALRFTRSGGTAVVVGLARTGARLDLDPAEFVRREKFLTGTMYGSEDPAVALPTLLEHADAGRLRLESSSARASRSTRSTPRSRRPSQAARPGPGHAVRVRARRREEQARRRAEPLGQREAARLLERRDARLDRRVRVEQPASASSPRRSDSR